MLSKQEPIFIPLNSCCCLPPWCQLKHISSHPFFSICALHFWICIKTGCGCTFICLCHRGDNLSFLWSRLLERGEQEKAQHGRGLRKAVVEVFKSWEPEIKVMSAKWMSGKVYFWPCGKLANRNTFSFSSISLSFFWEFFNKLFRNGQQWTDVSPFIREPKNSAKVPQ